jgi:hypothetical protein
MLIDGVLQNNVESLYNSMVYRTKCFFGTHRKIVFDAALGFNCYGRKEVAKFAKV